MNAKTRARIHRITFRIKPYVSESQLAALTEIVEHELREQDADTRKACSQAMLALDDGCCSSDSRSTLDAASRACMNVQAI